MKTSILMAEICQYALSNIELKIASLYAILDDLDEKEEKEAVRRIQEYKSKWSDINDVLLDLLKKFD